MNENILRRNEMKNADEVLNGQLQEGGLLDGSFAGRAPPTLLQGIAACKLILSTDDTHYKNELPPKMKVHLPLDLDILELEYLIITMAMSNGEEWAKRARLNKMESADDTVENTENNYMK